MPAKLVSTVSRHFLLAEDDPADTELVRAMLDETFGRNYKVDCVDRYSLVIEQLKLQHYDVLILDMNLPDSSGISNITHINEEFPTLPIVVLTGHDDIQSAIDTLKSGAQDFLSKNLVTPDILERSLRYAQERKRIELKLKHALDDSAQKNKQLELLARHDSLTGLPNRSYFETAAQKMLYRAERKSQALALLYFDLDGFKTINDSFGHGAGDELLRQVAIRVQSIVRDSDFLARIGGDEFVIITDLLNDVSEIYGLVNRLLSQFNPEFQLAVNKVNVNPSVGVAYYPDATTLKTLVKQADLAMYEAKKKRDTNVCFFTADMEALYSREIQIQSELMHAVERQEFSAAFQSIESFSGDHQLFEALMRWNSPTLGNVRPDEFIPVVEKSPLQNELTKGVVQRCISLLNTTHAQHINTARYTVNLSARQLCDRRFEATFISWLNELGGSPNDVILELTEREIVQNMQECSMQMLRLHNRGVQFALDDFGSGYSSITHLTVLPIEYLKLDRMLISNIDSNTKYKALNAGIVEMAHKLDMKVIAEGIETEAEYNTLRELGCDYFQGFYLSRPVYHADYLKQAANG